VTAERTRDLHLDGVRGVAILAVLALHLFRFSQASPGWMFLDRFTRAGWLGVDLFFVLSGFLITRILLRAREKPHYFRNFYMRRVLRIFPAYYLYLLVAGLLIPMLLSSWDGRPLGEWWPALLAYVPNLLEAVRGDWTPRIEMDHLWSLAVEEQFYLLWPLAVMLSPRERLKRVCELLIVSAWVLKCALWAAGAWKYTGYVLPFTRMDALAAGAWLACHRLEGGGALPGYVRGALVVAAAGVLVMLGALGGLPLHNYAAITLVTSFVAILFAGAMHGLWRPGATRARHAMEWAPLRFFGRYSYGLYLIHRVWGLLLVPPLVSGLTSTLGPNLAALVAGSVAVAIATGNAIVMYHVFEEPLLRLNRHFR
jgi:peptidoglycan/LPS O-acetylase OafA/YrhL